MNPRTIQLGVAVCLAFSLPFVGIAFNKVVTDWRRQPPTQAEREQMRVRNRFNSIKPVGIKALMDPIPIPTPGPKEPPTDINFYFMSGKGYWKKPMQISEGFHFGYFDGTNYHDYKIIKIRVDGLVLSYHHANQPVGPDLILNVPWK